MEKTSCMQYPNSEEPFCEERFSTLLVKTVKKGKYEMANTKPHHSQDRKVFYR